jgi:predicted glycoside hydrolase/deacetylase ChbG (UPF0249 family)
MKLIVNGDDLGYTRGVTEGILEGYHKGILRSTTALMSSSYIEESASLTKDCTDLGIGVHLNLTLDCPLTKNHTLTDPATGEFYHGRTEVWKHDPDYTEIYTEWKAQIEAFIRLFGKRPTHLDSHHSVHDATPKALEVAQRLAQEYQLPMRRYNHYAFVAEFYGSKEPVQLIAILEKYKDQDIEIMAHPAFADVDLYRKSSLCFPRVQELDVLCRQEVLEYIQEHQIQLVHYQGREDYQCR